MTSPSTVSNSNPKLISKSCCWKMILGTLEHCPFFFELLFWDARAALNGNWWKHWSISWGSTKTCVLLRGGSLVKLYSYSTVSSFKVKKAFDNNSSNPYPCPKVQSPKTRTFIKPILDVLNINNYPFHWFTKCSQKNSIIKLLVPSLKLTVRNWKWMVGRQSFWGWA